LKGSADGRLSTTDIALNPIEQPVQEVPRERIIIRDALVELEVRVRQVLELIGHDRLKGEAGVFSGVYSDAVG